MGPQGAFEGGAAATLTAWYSCSLKAAAMSSFIAASLFDRIVSRFAVVTYSNWFETVAVFANFINYRSLGSSKSFNTLNYIFSKSWPIDLNS